MTSTQPASRRLLITGCGRSGTKYISFVCRRLGVDVRHERLGRDGIASWTMETRRFGPPNGAVRFEHVFQQVRHPLPVIASVRSFEPASWEFISRHIRCPPDAPVELRGARYWLGWNELAERVAEWRYRIEDIDNQLEEFCARIGASFDSTALRRVPRNVNTREHGRIFHRAEELFERLTVDMPEIVRATLAVNRAPEVGGRLEWADLEALDPELAFRVRTKAASYGYDA
jgi:hypothetical protein